MKPQEDGQHFQAHIVKAIDDHEESTNQNPERIKFLCSINDDQYEEIMKYNDIVTHLQTDDPDDRVWKFRRMTAHEGPLAQHHPNYKGSKFNVMIEWENGEITSEPLTIIADDDPVTCALYAMENDLLDKPGWQ